MVTNNKSENSEGSFSLQYQQTVTCRMSRKDDYGSEWEGRDTSEGNSKFLNVFFSGKLLCYLIFNWEFWNLSQNGFAYYFRSDDECELVMHNRKIDLFSVRKSIRQNPSATVVTRGDEVTTIVLVWNWQAEVPLCTKQCDPPDWLTASNFQFSYRSHPKSRISKSKKGKVGLIKIQCTGKMSNPIFCTRICFKRTLMKWNHGHLCG